MSEIQQLYESILEKLKMGHRPRVSLTQTQNISLHEWFNSPDNWNSGLCILCHLKSPTDSFNREIEQILVSDHPFSYDLAPFLMGSLERHLIDLKTQTGNPPEPKLLKALSVYIKACPRRTLKYPLSLVESIGSANFYFKKVVLDLKWNTFSIFSKDQRLAIEIINRLEKKWSIFS